MGSTFVGIGDAGFWMRDSMLELWLRLLALHVENPVVHGLANRIRDNWLVASREGFVGCIPHGIDDAAASPEGASIVRAAVDSLLRALRAAPPTLGKDVFNLMGFGPEEFPADLETARLIEVGQAFLDLLDGNISPGDTSFVPRT